MNEDMNKEISLVTCKKNLPEEGAPAFSQSSLRPSWQGSRANSSRSDIRSVQRYILFRALKICHHIKSN